MDGARATECGGEFGFTDAHLVRGQEAPELFKDACAAARLWLRARLHATLVLVVTEGLQGESPLHSALVQVGGGEKVGPPSAEDVAQCDLGLAVVSVSQIEGEGINTSTIGPAGKCGAA